MPFKKLLKPLTACIYWCAQLIFHFYQNLCPSIKSLIFLLFLYAFGDRLRLLREEKKLTQIELGKLLNISNRVIAYYESNDRFPKDELTLVRIADFFDVSLDWLLGRTDIRGFQSNRVNILSIDLHELSEEDVLKIREYAIMLRKFKNEKEKE